MPCVNRTAVSYTHLPCASFILPDDEPLAVVGPADIPAVSYTHLDVYKRQGMYQPVPGKELSGPAGHGRGVQDAEIHWRQSGMFPGILEIADLY